MPIKNRRSKLEKALTRGASAAIATAPTANPYIIAPAALLSAGTAFLEDEYEFDPHPYRRALKQFGRGLRGGARRAADEAGANIGASLASRGLGGSGLGQGIVTGHRRLPLQRAEDQIAMEESNLEFQIADQETQIGRANATARNREIRNLVNDLGGLATHLMTTDTPLGRKLGTYKPNDGTAVATKSVGDSYSSSTDLPTVPKMFRSDADKPFDPITDIPSPGRQIRRTPDQLQRRRGQVSDSALPSSPQRMLPVPDLDSVAPPPGMEDEPSPFELPEVTVTAPSPFELPEVAVTAPRTAPADMRKGVPRLSDEMPPETLDVTNPEQTFSAPSSPSQTGTSGAITPKQEEFFISNRIMPNSELGGLYRYDFDTMSELEKALGLPTLKEVFGTGVSMDTEMLGTVSESSDIGIDEIREEAKSMLGEINPDTGANYTESEVLAIMRLVLTPAGSNPSAIDEVIREISDYLGG